PSHSSPACPSASARRCWSCDDCGPRTRFAQNAPRFRGHGNRWSSETSALPGGTMSLALRYAVRSDLGLVRGNNEDSVYAGPRLLAIADGMGGHAAGEVASKIAVAALAG